MNRIAVTIVAAGLAALGGGPAVRGTSRAQGSPQQTLRHDTAAIVKLVTVRVLDESGRPAMDLSREEFVLTDNGRRMTITEFEVHRLMAGLAVGESAGRPAAVEVRGGLHRKIFIFLDLQGSDENGLANAKQAIHHFLDTQLLPDDEVGIVGFSPMRGFFVQEYLTTDHDRIRRVVAKTKELPPSFGGAENPFPPDGSPRAAGGDEAGGAGAEGGVMGSGSNVSLGREPEPAAGFSLTSSSTFMPGTRAFMRGDFVPRLSDLAEVMKRLPGNKSLVLFTGRDLGGSATALGRAFADAGTPIYAVNTKNWIMKGVFSFVKEKHIYREHSLKDLSLASGGEYFADIEDIQGIAGGVQALTGNYYVLGYYIEESWDGKFHKIEVEVKNSGYRVLAQEGYFNPRPFAEMSDFEKDLHLFSLIYNEERALGDSPEIPMAALDASAPGGPEGVVLLELAVDPKTGVSPAPVELFALIRNADLESVVSTKWDLDLSVHEGKTIVLCLYVPFKPGEYDGRIAVRDTATGRSAVGRITFEVGAPPEGGLFLGSPMILVPGVETKIAGLPAGGTRRGSPPGPNLVNLYPFIPRKHRIVVRNLDFAMGRIQAVLPIRIGTVDPDKRPRIEITGRLFRKEGGEEILLDLEVLEVKASGDGREFLIIDINLPVLERGAYDLVITADDIDTDRSVSVKTPLVIK